MLKAPRKRFCQSVADEEKEPVAPRADETASLRNAVNELKKQLGKAEAKNKSTVDRLNAKVEYLECEVQDVKDDRQYYKNRLDKSEKERATLQRQEKKIKDKMEKDLGKANDTINSLKSCKDTRKALAMVTKERKMAKTIKVYPKHSMTGPPPPPNVSQAVIDNITQKVREEQQNKTKKGFETLENTIKEMSCKLAAAETLLKKQDEVIQSSRRRSSSPNTSDALIPDINEEEHRENKKLKEKLKNLEVENHQLRHAKAEVSRLQEILKTENQKLEAMMKEKNSMDLKLQDSEKKLKEEKDTLAKVNVNFKLELQRIKMEKEQNAKILSPGTPGEDSKDIQIKKLQDALEDEKKKTAESQAQCAKEKEKISDLEHQLHQKMKEIQELEATDVVSTEVQTDPMSTESDDKTSVEHTKSLQIRIHELVAVKNVMRGELMKLKRKFSMEDGKTDDLSKSERKKKKKDEADCKDDGKLEEQELKERSSDPKPIDTTANEEKSEVKDKVKVKRTGGIAKDDKKMEQKDGKSESSSDPKPVDTATNDEKSEVKDGDKAKESNEIAKDDRKKKEQKVRRSVNLSAKEPIASTKDEKKLKEKESDGISEVKKKKSSSDKEPDTAAKDKQKSDKTPHTKMEKKKATLENEKKKTAESQAQCAKEKDKISDLEHQLKMKEIQELEAKDVVSTEVQTVPMSTESNDKTPIEHTSSLKIRIHKLMAVKNVMRGELRKLKRKFSMEDGKTDDLSKSERKKKKKDKAGCKDDGKLEKQELKERSSEKAETKNKSTVDRLNAKVKDEMEKDLGKANDTINSLKFSKLVRKMDNETVLNASILEPKLWSGVNVDRFMEVVHLLGYSMDDEFMKVLVKAFSSINMRGMRAVIDFHTRKSSLEESGSLVDYIFAINGGTSQEKDEKIVTDGLITRKNFNEFCENFIAKFQKGNVEVKEETLRFSVLECKNLDCSDDEPIDLEKYMRTTESEVTEQYRDVAVTEEDIPTLKKYLKLCTGLPFGSNESFCFDYKGIETKFGVKDEKDVQTLFDRYNEKKSSPVIYLSDLKKCDLFVEFDDLEGKVCIYINGYDKDGNRIEFNPACGSYRVGSTTIATYTPPYQNYTFIRFSTEIEAKKDFIQKSLEDIGYSFLHIFFD